MIQTLVLFSGFQAICVRQDVFYEDYINKINSLNHIRQPFKKSQDSGLDINYEYLCLFLRQTIDQSTNKYYL